VIVLVEDFKLEPIGIVEEGISRGKPSRARKSRYQVTSRIRVFDRYLEGLTGLSGYSHIIILWLMHKASDARLRVPPWGSMDHADVGIFATRFPIRPNHIGVSVVQLVRISKGRLSVKGFDAWTGTPVLDIKPYDYYDIVKSPRVPDWFLRSWKEHAAKRRTENVRWLGP
jgi:tRNA-Thr(GGU) m(6)t(6)A37 methyltransferase TsaA